MSILVAQSSHLWKRQSDRYEPEHVGNTTHHHQMELSPSAPSDPMDEEEGGGDSSHSGDVSSAFLVIFVSLAVLIIVVLVFYIHISLRVSEDTSIIEKMLHNSPSSSVFPSV
jgi:hypothetical protein